MLYLWFLNFDFNMCMWGILEHMSTYYKMMLIISRYFLLFCFICIMIIIIIIITVFPVEGYQTSCLTAFLMVSC